MMCARVCAVTLMSLLVVAACTSTGKSSGSDTHQLRCEPVEGLDLTRELNGKTVREGRNQVATFKTGRLWAVVADGELDSLVLEEDGQPPMVALVADPAPPSTEETPGSCGQLLDNCVRRCESAADQACCECRCLISYLLCERRQGRAVMRIQ
jgi:hypothetical protein